MRQSWRDLSFLHFSCPVEAIQPLLPSGLRVDSYDGRAWVGLVPFRMHGIRLPWAPAVPWLSAFPETNVRTYVHRKGEEPGVWFFSLDAARWLACKYARGAFCLPYHHARMSVRAGSEIHYRSEREGAVLDVRVRPGKALQTPEPGSLEFFLVERYLLYAQRPDGLYTGRVFHPPYPLQELELLACDETLFRANGIERRPFEHLCFSKGVDVEVFSLER